MLTMTLAEKIVDEVKKVLTEEIIITQTNGTIIAATDPARIGQFHEGAYLTSFEGQKRILTKDDEQRMKGVKAGINLPIYFKQEVIGVIGMTGNPVHVSPFGEILRKMTELLIQEHEFFLETETDERQLEAFVFDWLHLPETAIDLTEKAARLQLDINKQRAVVLIDCHDESFMKQDQYKKVKEMLHLTNQEMIVRWGHARFLLMLQTSANDRDTLRQRLFHIHAALTAHPKSKVLIGAGKPAAGQMMKQSFHQAFRALKMANADTPIVFDEDLTLELFIEEVSQETKEVFLDRTIVPLLPYPELVKTLRVLMTSDCSLKYTAEAMHVHINTLHYRLKRIQDLTTLDPKRMQDAMLFYLALMLLDHHPNKRGEKPDIL
ncbi:sugar diacid recognition domain-containing protein [Bacillus sp. FSL W8-0920]|uniref:CdaR family transcriptional regulator n=1 Tax=Bacillus TaxID=1386 RepID=UPI000D03B78D|nr:sugar diacid recognition domain-containing protein [Bacillus pumilus]MBR0592222.1 carbohydrate diacid regulator [Bacillus pumilus sxm20-2]MCP1529923.1 carbohydrate diacid regulator [Bacillus pumilus]MDF9785312.1 carbohydrate diacid regulator [Bacillus pumilus]MDR0122771.1 sugar diacid recognition domain-containing protein [Bacillus pumilus]PRS33087.1 carbohydrate diacid regulator [Bacillus pumilus]